MAEAIASITAERTRVMSGGRRLSARILQTPAERAAGTATLLIKDSRLEAQNTALSGSGYRPGSWHAYTVAQSQAAFS
jgi:hypothetical protein